MNKERLSGLLDDMQGHRVVVVGDVMLDEYIWGRVSRISPEAPVPVVLAHPQGSDDLRPGGAGNVAANLRELGADVSLVSVLGKDRSGEQLLDVLRQKGIEFHGIVDAHRMTTHKVRVMAEHRSQQMLRIDHEIPAKLSAKDAESLVNRVKQELERADALLVSDYDKGVTVQATIQPVIAAAMAQRKLVTVDGKPANFGFFRGADLITPNEAEAATASGIAIQEHAGVREAGQELINRYELGAALITQGEYGMSLITRDGQFAHIAALDSHVYDVTGAGDTVIACCTLALASGAGLVEAATLANCAAGVVVKKVGTATASPEEIRVLL